MLNRPEIVYTMEQREFDVTLQYDSCFYLLECLAHDTSKMVEKPLLL